ncbi:restriction endonuclease subunit S [Candidatus Poribacteria bacterium]|nr:restriction endonuclease subunit S [Candidatus Poribacteria bacterium]
MWRWIGVNNEQRLSGEWETKRLKELGLFSKGRGIKRDDVTDEGVPCIRYGELYTRYQDYILKVASRIPPDVAETALPIKTGDLLFAGSGETAEEIGQCAAYLGKEQAYAGGDVIVLTPSGQNPIFLGHLMNSPMVAAQKARMGQGDAVVHIYINNLAQVQIELPPITEQNAVAEVLSDVDGLINALDALIAKKRAIKQATMQQLLTGKTRLPGFSGAWETKLLGDIAHIKTGSKNNEDKNDNGQYPLFVRSAVVERINSYCFDGEAILVPGEGGIENIFHYINGRFDCHQRVYMINQFVDDVFGKLIYYIMVLQFGRHAMQNTVKATVDSLRLPTFQTFTFSIPKDIAEQRAIATVLSDMDAEIAALEQRRDKTIAIKQGMMQQLLTGRVRLVKKE